MDQNPYQPPDALLSDDTQGGFTSPEGSLEKALAGDYEISISEIRREAWRLTRGNKGTFMLAVFLVGIVQIGGSLVLTGLGIPNGQAELAAGDFVAGYGKSLFLGFLMMPLIVPLSTGLLMLSIKRAGGLNAGLSELGAYYRYLPKLVLVSIISALLVYLGFALLIFPGIYLTVAYAFAIPLMIDKGLSPWQSLEAARKSVTHHWFAVFGAMLVVYLLAMLLGITLIGLAWGLPMMMLGFGILYRKIFGFGPEDGDRGEATQRA